MQAALELFKEIGFGIALTSEIKNRYGKRCWTGEDGIVAEQVILPPNIPTVVEGEGSYRKDTEGHLVYSNPPTDVPVLLKPETIPQLSMLKFIPKTAELSVSALLLDDLYGQGGLPLLLIASTKSRFAQIGVEVSDWQDIPANTWRQLARGKDVIVPMNVNNYSSRPVIIPSGMPLFRFVSPLLTPYLKGEGLFQTYNAGLINVEGKQGDTWEWSYADNTDMPDLRNKKSIYGMRIKLKPDLKWIPPSNEPINMENFVGPDYRRKIDDLLEPVPDFDTPVLCISETYPLRLADSISGFINIYTSPWGRQINSRYIDPISNWGIRVEEILSPITAKSEERYMEIFYLKSIK